MPGNIYLLPMLIGDVNPHNVIPQQVQNTITALRFFFTENVKTTRRYLKKLDKSFDIDGSNFYVLNKNTPVSELQEMLQLVKTGNDAGIISEAGLPGIGDPGSRLVSMAHQHQVRVVPLTGPSSFVLALIASGLNGQSFAFHGYLPVKNPQLQHKIRELEKISGQTDQTQIFMETPYRNNQLMKKLTEVCSPGTKLCVAANITTSAEFIRTQTIKQWSNAEINIHKVPAVFAILKQT